jgi:hypothetical protein
MKYVYSFAALVTVLLIFSAAANAEVRMRHRCLFPDGHYEERACPSTWHGKPMIVNCHTWNKPHKHRHAGWCKTPG